MTDTPALADGRRAGATWVAATGAFLLVAAAAVFIAVRWDTLPEAAKLGLVGVLTAGFLVGGRASVARCLRPATCCSTSAPSSFRWTSPASTSASPSAGGRSC